MKRINVSEILKEYRIKNDLSQEELAQKLNISFVSLNRWERGKSAPSRLALMRMKELKIL